MSSVISFFGLLILALCRLLILAQAPLPAQPLQALMHFLRWAWAFCILELSLLLYQLTDLGLVQALVFLHCSGNSLVQAGLVVCLVQAEPSLV